MEPIPWTDTERYGGVVGKYPPKENEVPIIFVHGNGRKALDWEYYFDYFIEAGFNPSRLWAISFDNSVRTHLSLAEQLDEFVTNVVSETKATEVIFIGHSLGVTVGRVWLEKYDRYSLVSKFISLGGANHGLDICGTPAISESLPSDHYLKPCQTLGTPFLDQSPIEKLNKEIGETPGDIKYYTVRGKYDSFFASNPKSPELEGAEKNITVETDHDGLLTERSVIQQVFSFVENKK